MNFSKVFLTILLACFKVYSMDNGLSELDIVKEFHESIENNKVDKVRYFLAKYNYLDLANSTDKNGNSSLWLACINCHKIDLDIVKLLLKYGADKLFISPNNKFTPFHCLIMNLLNNKKDITEFIKYLIQKNFNIESPLSNVSVDNNEVKCKSVLNFIINDYLKSYLITRGVSLCEVNRDTFVNLPNYPTIQKYLELNEISLDLNSLEKNINQINQNDINSMLLLFNIGLNSNNVDLINKLVTYFNTLDIVIEYYYKHFRYNQDAKWPIFILEEWIYNYLNKQNLDFKSLSLKDISYIIIKNIIKKVKPNSLGLYCYLIDKAKKQEINLKKIKVKNLEFIKNFQENLLNKVKQSDYSDITIINS